METTKLEPSDSSEGATVKEQLSDKVLAERLIQKLSIVPHHAISLRRNKYRVIRRISRELGWDLVQDKDASILWLDKWEASDMTNLRYGKVGHFLGMRDVSTKCSLGRTLNRMKQEFPLEYDYHPVTFVLPTDKEKLLEYAAAFATASSTSGSKAAAAISVLNSGGVGSASAPTYLNKVKARSTDPSVELGAPLHGCWPLPGVQAQPQPTSGDKLVFIVKPDASSRGNGIYLALTLADIKELDDAEEPKAKKPPAPTADSDSDDQEEMKKLTLVQTYLPRPLLLNERKFDLRIYVLVTAAYPTLRVYIYRQGLVRFATEDYAAPNAANVKHRKMFLTNYAVNKATEAPGTAGLPDDFPDDESEASDDADALEEADPAGADKTKKSTVIKQKSGRKDPVLPPRAKQRELLAAREGCKWSLEALLCTLKDQGVDTDTLWLRIKDIIAKTMLAIRPGMAQKYRAARPQLRKEPPPPEPVQRKPRVIPRSSSTRRPPRAQMPARPAATSQPTPGCPANIGIPEESNCDGISPRRPHSASSPRDFVRTTLSGTESWSNPAVGPEDSNYGFRPTPEPRAPASSGILGSLRLSAAGSSIVGGKQLTITPTASIPVGAPLGSSPVGFGIMGTSMTLGALKLQPRQVASKSARSSAESTPKSNSMGFGVSGASAAFSLRPMEAPLSKPVGLSARPLPVPKLRPSVDNSSDTGMLASDTTVSSASVGEDGGGTKFISPPSASASDSASKKKKKNESPPDEEDGEQGFRCYELMGLDVILDMSHCTCADKDACQRMTSKPGAKPMKRCQPRPVLLEINQSCSLHSDSDLDRVIKGDVVRDAMCMSAPDEAWLLERFKEVLQMRLPAAPDVAEYDPEADRRRLSRTKVVPLADTASFDDIPEQHVNVAHFAHLAAEEAENLVSIYSAPPVSTSSPPVPNGRERADSGDTGRSAESVRARSMSRLKEPAIPLVPTNLATVPWIPPPYKLIMDALADAWKEETWFGYGPQDLPKAAPSPTGSGGKETPTPSTWSTHSLNRVPPLSNRAQLVLMLRRLYEHIHIGGFQKLTPPTSASVLERYKRIADYVPPQLRETAAFARRRQEALAIRAALEAKKYTR